MRQPGHLIVAFHKDGGIRERRSFEASEAAFDMESRAGIPARPALNTSTPGRIGGIRSPTQHRHQSGNRLSIALAPR